MTGIAAPGRARWSRPSRATAVTAAVAGSAQIGLAALAFQGELAALSRLAAAALVVDIAAAVLGLLVLPLAARWPVRTALLESVLLTVSAAATPLAGTAALWVARRRRLPAAVGVAAAGVLAHLVRGLWRPVPGRPVILWLVFVLAAYAAIVGWGGMAQARRALVCSLEERAERAEAEQAARIAEARRAERTRIAREMHDVLAHRLSLLATWAGAVEFRPDAPREDLVRAASVVRAGARQALEELREVIGVLREDESADPDHPQPTLTDVHRLVAESRDAGTAVTLDDRVVDAAAVPAALGRTVYRIVQEALTNARRHAPGRPVKVIVVGGPGDRLTVLVENPLGPPSTAPGGGPGAGPVGAPGSGTGLVGVRERVELAGGRMDSGPARGRFWLRASLPWSA